MMIRPTAYRALLGALVVGAAACSSDQLQIPNYNAPTTEGVAKDPSAIQLLATGVLSRNRDNWAGMVNDFGIFGRESYNYFPTDSRNISNYLIGIPGPQRLDPGGFANGQWGGRFTEIKSQLALIASANASTLSAQDKAAVSGFAKTFEGLDYLYLIASRDTLGAPIGIPDDPNTPQPFQTRDKVYDTAISILDDAKKDLQAAGPTFPFTLHSGFTSNGTFNTPATFLKFNRAIMARAQVYRGSLGCGATCYQAALQALSESFVTPLGNVGSQANLDIGVYHIFSTASGDTPNANSFAQQNYKYAHASAETDAQKQANGTLDDRFVRKVTRLASPVAPPQNLNIPATHRFLMYATPSSPAAIIRNEELILLRAEANIQTNNLTAALQDINDVRVVSGKLAPLPAFTSTAQAMDALKYEKRYSTLFEGLRWVDMRRWGRLGELPIDQPGQFVARVMPIPQAECDARTVKPTGC